MAKSVRHYQKAYWAAMNGSAIQKEVKKAMAELAKAKRKAKKAAAPKKRKTTRKKSTGDLFGLL